ncbi:hypothetical protein [Actinoplanes missouriensis]|uniref:hypothetical protein n=1 Tax=Actinoplanes missouriensis TaxID=1866 RepID=UPI0012FC4F3A|nr:hypothetical protein [Actinoplanes missouriensis]
MTGDVREQLAANAARRAEIAAAASANEQEERDLIVRAWRENVPPGEIATLVGRSGAHVRKFRPDDVPPAKLGGNAATKKRRK